MGSRSRPTISRALQRFVAVLSRRRAAAGLLAAAAVLTVTGGAFGLTNFSGSLTTGWTQIVPANAPYDYVLDQQTGATSGDIVGDGAHPAFLVQSDGTKLAFRMRINAQDSNNATLKFNNFAFVGVDANQDGSVDLFLGVYNPTGNNGRVAIYSSDPGSLNVSPSTTGIGGAPVYTETPASGTNYSIVAVGDGSSFSGNTDYFLSWALPFAQIQSKLAARGIPGVTTSTPLRYIVGTAQQDNAFNVDISGMSGIDTKDVRTWQELGAFTPFVTADGSSVPALSGPTNYLDATQSTPVSTPLTFTSSISAQGISVVDPDSATLTVTLTVANGTFSLSGTSGLSFGSGDGTGDASMAFTGSQVNINAALNNSVFTPTNVFTGTATITIATTDGSTTDTDTMFIAVPSNPETTAPTLVSTVPADNATGVDPAADLVLTFSEPIVFGTAGTITVFAAGGVPFETFNVATGAGNLGGTASFTGSAVTLNPGANLADGSSYYVQISSTAITDLNGNAFAGIANATTLDFATAGADLTAPTLVSSVPDDGAVGVDRTADLTLTFSEPVAFGSSGTISIFTAAGATVEVFNVATGAGGGGGSVSVSGSTVRLNPGSDLAAGSSYYVQVTATAIQDLSGNSYAGIANATTLDFMTATVDVTAPTLVSSVPADNAAGVDRAADLVLTFSESVVAGTAGTITLFAAGGTAVETFDVATGTGSAGGSVSISGSVLTVNPFAALAAGSGFYVQISSAAIKDPGGNAYAGIADATSLDFTTAAVDVTAPTLVGSVPADNAAGVDRAADLVLTFSESVVAGTAGTITLFAAGGTAVETFDVATGTGSAGGSVSVSGSTVTVDPGSALAAGSGYYLQISATAIKDPSGNSYAGIADATSLDFTIATADTERAADAGVADTTSPKASTSPSPPTAAGPAASAPAPPATSAPTNRAPRPGGDAATAAAGKAVRIQVLSNDRDPDGDALVLAGFTNGRHGTVTCASTGCLYTAAPGFSGTDSFSYTVSDRKGKRSTGVVTVAVKAAVVVVNARPAPQPTEGCTVDVTKPGASVAYLSVGIRTTLRVFVRTADGEPLARVPVHLYGLSVPRTKLMTNRSGAARVTLSAGEPGGWVVVDGGPCGSVRITTPLSHDCSGLHIRPATIAAGGSEALPITVRLRAKPVKRTRVVVQGAGEHASTTTDARGSARVVVHTTRPGLLRVTVPTVFSCSRAVGVLSAEAGSQLTG